MFKVHSSVFNLFYKLTNFKVLKVFFKVFRPNNVLFRIFLKTRVLPEDPATSNTGNDGENLTLNVNDPGASTSKRQTMDPNQRNYRCHAVYNFFALRNKKKQVSRFSTSHVLIDWCKKSMFSYIRQHFPAEFVKMLDTHGQSFMQIEDKYKKGVKYEKNS